MSGFEITEAGDMKSIKFTVPGNPFGKQRPTDEVPTQEN